MRTAIQERYPAHPVSLIDGSLFPTKATFSATPSGWRWRSDTEEIDSRDVAAVWSRRPQQPKVSASIADVASRNFARAECIHALDLIGMSYEYRVVNRPGRQLEANRKPLQLEIARRLGFTVPDYTVTNDSETVHGLAVDKDSKRIFKTLTAPVHTFGETRRLTLGHAEIASAASLAPFIIQDEVERRRELRVTIVGEQVFCHEMIVQNERAKKFPDWRIDPIAIASPVTLEPDLLKKISRLMEVLGLGYGAIDLIEHENREICFLEINPAGQFLFAEIDTGQSICSAMADLLVGPARPGLVGRL